MKNSLDKNSKLYSLISELIGNNREFAIFKRNTKDNDKVTLESRKTPGMGLIIDEVYNILKQNHCINNEVIKPTWDDREVFGDFNKCVFFLVFGTEKIDKLIVDSNFFYHVKKKGKELLKRTNNTNVVMHYKQAHENKYYKKDEKALLKNIENIKKYINDFDFEKEQVNIFDLIKN